MRPANSLGPLLAVLLLAANPGSQAAAAPTSPAPVDAMADLPAEFSGSLRLTWDARLYSQLSASGLRRTWTGKGSLDMSVTSGAAESLQGEATSVTGEVAWDADCSGSATWSTPADAAGSASFELTPSLLDPADWAFNHLAFRAHQVVEGCYVDEWGVPQDPESDVIVQDGVWSVVDPIRLRSLDDWDTTHRLRGNRTWTLDSRALVRHNRDACEPPATECYTRFALTLDYDLSRLPPTDPASQYPVLRARNNSFGNDVLRLRTDRAAPHADVLIWYIEPRKGTWPMVAVLERRADEFGALKMVVKDPKRSRRTYIAVVRPNEFTVPGNAPPVFLR